MVALVRGACGLVRSVSFADGLVSVDIGGVVSRHRVGARGGIPVAASRDLWRALQMWKRVGVIVSLSGRPGWAGWFDAVAVADASHGLSAGDLAWQDCLCREVLKELRGEDDFREESALEEASENGLYYDGERYCALPA